MNIINKILGNTNDTKLQQGVENVQSIIEETDSQKEAKQKAIDAAIKQIEKQPDMPVGEFMKMLQEQTDLSDLDLVQIIKQLPDVKSEKATIAAVQSTSLPSQAIKEIIEEAPIGLDTAKKIANEIPDEDIQKEQQEKLEKIMQDEQKKKALEEENRILEQLSMFYENCSKISTPVLVNKIQFLNIKNKTQNISRKLMHVIARKTAFDFMNYGSPRIPTLRMVVPSTDMYEANLVSMVEKEYNDIRESYETQQKKYYKLNVDKKNLITKLLLEDIAKQSAVAFDDVGDFGIPQTQRFQSLSKDEIRIFVNTIKTYSKDFNTSSERRLVRQLSGEASIQGELDSLLEELKTQIINLPVNMQLSTVNAILDTLKQREEAIGLINSLKSKNETNSSHDAKTDIGENR